MTLSVEDLTVHYGSFTAVSRACLDIADGEVLALLGPSGSGKSTLLRGIVGLEPLSSGRVRWDGEELTGTPVHKRGFGLVFQDGQLFPHRDVAGNVAFGPRMHGIDAAARTAKVRELLDLVGLTGYQRRSVSGLSGGEAQRVALARALAPEPRLLLLDEPLSGLDAELREQLAFDLADLLRKAKISTLLVTHDQEEAFTLADRVAVLRAGRIEQLGGVDEVWRRPVNDEVARFLGVTTLLDAAAEGGVVDTPLGALSLPDAADGTVRIGLRPNGIRVAEEGVPAVVVGRAHRRDHLRLVVRPDVHAAMAESTGLESIVEGRGDGTVDAVAAISRTVRIGAEVRLALDPDGAAVVG